MLARRNRSRGRGLLRLHGKMCIESRQAFQTLLASCGCGSKLTCRSGTAGFGPWFHLPRFHFGYIFDPLPCLNGEWGNPPPGPNGPNRMRHTAATQVHESVGLKPVPNSEIEPGIYMLLEQHFKCVLTFALFWVVQQEATLAHWLSERGQRMTLVFSI